MTHKIKGTEEEFESIQKTKQKKPLIREVDYDDLLISAGEFGCYQLILFFSTFPFYLYGVFVYLSQLFMTEASSSHWCWIPELGNLTDIERRTLAIPPDTENRYGHSRCEAYVANWTEVLATGVKPNASWPTMPCQYGWEFNKSEIPYPTITSDMGWVCDKSSYQATAQAFYFFGSVLGCLPIGWIADKYGRVPAAVLSNLIACFGGVISVFVTNFTQFVICRFIMGIAGERCMLIVYLLVIEYVAPKYRTLISNLSFGLFFALIAVTMPWISLACGNWKIFGLVTSIPMALAVFAPLIIPESPRWLLSKGRTDEAIDKVLKIALVNKKTVPESLIEEFKLSELNREQENDKSWIELLRIPKLRKMLCCMCFLYMCCTLTFDALVRSIGKLEFNYFISFSIMSSTELPSLILVALLLDWSGRRLYVFVSMIMICIFAIMSTFVEGGLPSLICVLVARFFSNMSYAVGELWSPEMMPTAARASGSSFVNICGYFAMIFAPYVVYLENYVQWLPFLLVGIAGGCGALISLTLPETANRKLPQTFGDAEEMLANNKLNIPCLKNRKEDRSAESMIAKANIPNKDI